MELYMKLRACPLLAALLLASTARADVFQWEYINPGNPSQGKQQSITLCPDGAGAYAVASANLDSRNLTMAYLIGADLTHASASGANMSDADLGQANLTGAYFPFAILVNC